MSEEVEIVSLLPETVHIRRGDGTWATFAPSGTVARVAVGQRVVIDTLNDLQVYDELTEVREVPPEDGFWTTLIERRRQRRYLVPRAVQRALPWRHDLYALGEEVRSLDGGLKGYDGLVRQLALDAEEEGQGDHEEE